MAVYNYTVTVVASATYGQNVFALNGVEKPQLSIAVGDTVNLDLSDNSVYGHPLGIGPDNSDTTAYGSGDGVTYTVNGSNYSTFAAFESAFLSANAGDPASVSWVVNSAADINSWYFCGVHSNMGNTVTIAGGTDYDAPSSHSISINAGALETTSDAVNLTLNASDNVGVTGYYVSEDNTTPTAGLFTSITPAQNYTDIVSFTLSSGFGSKTVYAWYIDATGNISSAVNDSINYVSNDVDAPYNGTIVLAGGAAETTTTSITVDLSASDDVEVTGYYLSESDTTPSIGDFISVTPAQNFSGTVNFTLSATNGEHYVYGWFRDFGENISTQVYDSINLSLPDSNVPINPSITINSGASTTDNLQVSCQISGFDSVGIDGYYLSETNSTPSAESFIPTPIVQNFVQTVIFNLSTGDGAKTVYLWLKDAADNISTVSSDSIILDTSLIAPEVDQLAPVNNGITILQGAEVDTRLITVQISASDAVGVAGYYLSESPNPPTAGQFTLISESNLVSLTRNYLFLLNEASGRKIIHCWFVDNTGNISNVSTDTVILNYAGAAEANYLMRDAIIQTNRPGFVQATTFPVNTNTLVFGPVQVSNTLTINGTLAVLNEMDVVEGGIVNIVGTLDLR